jgi:NAD dependent epimerase/dehydratase family enzyme
MPWIALDDAVSALLHVIDHDALAGPVNVVAPEAVRQRDLARALGRVLHRPAFVPAPRWALRLALGAMADGMLLGSQRVVPRRLVDSGFRFRFSGLEPALRAVLAPERAA